ncbi:MAG: aquaporin family protein [Bacteroidetes bacterium]|nr:aquaporin family protein [Bacteroidota bacterium]
MTPFIAELVGTTVLITLGLSVVANVALDKTKGQNAGLIVVGFAWAIAVFVGVFISADISGAHLNPAVTIALAVAGKFEWGLVPGYILAQFLGAFSGALLTWLTYKGHFDASKDPASILGVFSTGPAIRNSMQNLMTEAIASFIFMLAVFFIQAGEVKLGSIDALPVALLVLGIGLSMGGPTGYAINPARDLGPRIMHALLPIPHKGSSDWKYAFIPVVGPVLGAVLAAFLYMAL